MKIQQEELVCCFLPVNLAERAKFTFRPQMALISQIEVAAGQKQTAVHHFVSLYSLALQQAALYGLLQEERLILQGRLYVYDQISNL